MLGRHAGLVCPPELKLFHRYHRASSRVRRRTVSRLCQDLDALLPAEAARRSFPTGRLYDLIRYRGVRRSGKSNDALLVDKTPEHSFRLP